MKRSFFPYFIIPLVALLLILQACSFSSASDGTQTPITNSEPVLTLAAKTVSAQLTLDSSQNATTPVPSNTPFPLPSLPVKSPTRAPATLPAGAPTSTLRVTPCDTAAFISDVTIPDNTIFKPNQAFTKTWRLQNSGTCSWSTAYGVSFLGGDLMKAPTTYTLQAVVAPGQSLDLSLKMVAPATPKTYKGTWKLKNAGGTAFGDSFYVQIIVKAPTATPHAGLPSSPVAILPGWQDQWIFNFRPDSARKPGLFLFQQIHFIF
jgi:hypothetical protein